MSAGSFFASIVRDTRPRTWTGAGAPPVASSAFGGDAREAPAASAALSPPAMRLGIPPVPNDADTRASTPVAPQPSAPTMAPPRVEAATTGAVPPIESPSGIERPSMRTGERRPTETIPGPADALARRLSYDAPRSSVQILDESLASNPPASGEGRGAAAVPAVPSRFLITPARIDAASGPLADSGFAEDGDAATRATAPPSPRLHTAPGAAVPVAMSFDTVPASRPGIAATDAERPGTLDPQPAAPTERTPRHEPPRVHIGVVEVVVAAPEPRPSPATPVPAPSIVSARYLRSL